MNDVIGAILRVLFYLSITVGITVLVEGGLIALVGKWRAFRRPSLILNVLTNPIVNLILPALYIGVKEVFVRRMWNAATLTVFLLVEVGVIILEAWMYRILTGEPYRRTVPVSIAANLLSALIGTFIGIFIYF